MLFNHKNIHDIVEKADLTCSKVYQVQRYNLANHLFWLSKGLPAGHKAWSHISSSKSDNEYYKMLSKNNLCDTIFVEIKKI